MFEDVGSKIKTIAKAVFAVGAVISIFSFFVWLGIADEVSWRYEDTVKTIAWVSLIIGIFSSWIGSIFVYGYGELIERSVETSDEIKELKFILSARENDSPAARGARAAVIRDIEENLPDM